MKILDRFVVQLVSVERGVPHSNVTFFYQSNGLSLSFPVPNRRIAVIGMADFSFTAQKEALATQNIVHKRRMRNSHGPDPNIPPRGWVPR
ncbi:MAG: hypothetical protein AAB758_01185 [Patescibacteria group bacterium]